MTGRIQFWMAPIPTRLEQINSGQLRALAVAGNDRSADLPGIPTIKESGFGDFDASTTYAVFAPKGTPPQVSPANRLARLDLPYAAAGAICAGRSRSGL
jgi:tripartite-type tricarboxylate transporter receptor subunit TctC